MLQERKQTGLKYTNEEKRQDTQTPSCKTLDGATEAWDKKC